MSTTALSGIIGESAPMLRLRALIVRVAATELPVLIQGPTGTGKELVARALHELSGRPGSLVAFNICAIADSMFEDELFGHVRGAFTGATGDRTGYLAEAHRGTTFFDEIGSLPFGFQAKLLRALETRQFRPVGGRRDVTSDFRVVSAINEPLAGLVATSRFREDLAQRLSGFVIDVPSLSARGQDIPLLASHFAERVNGQRQHTTFSAGAIRTLQEHAWPGNVRELRHVIERAVLLSERSLLRTADIAAAIGLTSAARHENGAEMRERILLLSALRQSGWDTTRAAALLGVHRGTIYRRMQRLGISAPPPATPRSTSVPGD